METELDDTQSITFKTEGNIFTFSGRNFEQTVDFYPIEEFNCRQTKMFDVGDHEDSILDVIINKSGFIAFRYRSRYFKNNYAYAMCDDDMILFYIDRQGRLFKKINMTKPFGTIYHAYKAFYHFR